MFNRVIIILILGILMLFYSTVLTSYATSMTSYQYDDQYRLMSVSRSDGTTIQYHYDAAGNRSRKIITTQIITDTTPPTITTFTLPATSSYLTVTGITIAATDNVGVASYYLSESTSQPTVNDSNWTTIAPSQYTFSTIGDKTLYVWAKDIAGNISLNSYAVTTIVPADTTAPTVTWFNIPATSNSLTIAITGFTATDDVGVTGYCLTETNNSSGCSWSATAPPNYAFSTAGNLSLYAWVRDAAGNISPSVRADSMITQTDPMPPVLIPRTGQTGCYATNGGAVTCAGTGQDGELQKGIPWPGQRFTDNGNQTVTDHLTGLIWTKDANAPGPPACTPSIAKTWQGALDHVKCLNTNAYLGIADWRLPNRNEMASIVSSGYGNFQSFSSVKSDYYWTSTSWSFQTYSAYIILLPDGDVTLGNKGNSFYLWPVHGGNPESVKGITLPKTGQVDCYDASGLLVTCSATGQDGDLQKGVSWPEPRFSNNGNQTVTDKLTGLIWSEYANAPGPSACGPATAKTWQGALDYIKCLNANAYLGFSDWRLPNINELSSLVNNSQVNLAAWLNQQGFTAVQSDDYWSSTTSAKSHSDALFLEANMWCDVYPGSKLSGYYVWPVRGEIMSLVVTKSGTGSGTVSADNGSIVWAGAGGVAAFSKGSLVTLTALPDINSTFSGWGGACNGTGTCVLTIDAIKSVTATFTQNIPSSISSTTSATFVVGVPGSFSITTGGYPVPSISYTGVLPAGVSIDLAAGTLSGTPAIGSAGTYPLTFTVHNNVTPDAVQSFSLIVKPFAMSVPATGQLNCYDSNGDIVLCAGTGQDGELRKGDVLTGQRFTGNADQSITDNQTGLIWYSGVTDTPNFANLAMFMSYINNNTGRTDWRMPNITELHSLVNKNETSTTAWLRSQGFSNMQSDRYWSSNTYLGNTGNALLIHMVYGYISAMSKESFYPYIPVRGTMKAGAVWPNPRFADNQDQTMTDNLTGLIWTKDGKTPGPVICNSSTTLTWQESFDYIKCLNENNWLSKNDWHLPNSNELFSLSNFELQNIPSWLHANSFENIQNAYWTSTSYVTAPINAWVADMTADGIQGVVGKNSKYHAWPVRNDYINLVALNLNKTGTGTGNVSSSNGSINWGGNIGVVNLQLGTQVTVTALPDADSFFAGWSGVCSGSGFCEVAFDSNKSLTAIFNKNPVNGSCGASNNGTFTTKPTVNLCLDGSSPGVNGNGPWSWTCQGAFGGTNSSCSATIQSYAVSFQSGGGGAITGSVNQIVNHGKNAVTVNAVADTGYHFVSWTANSTIVSTNSSLIITNVTAPSSYTANFALDPVDGMCGNSNGANVTTIPTTGLCSSGVQSQVTGIGPYNWTCTGSNGGLTENCSANLTLNGVCGSSNGGTFISAPASNLCTTGTPSLVTGVGPWAWTCQGNYGGANANCNASYDPYLPVSLLDISNWIIGRGSASMSDGELTVGATHGDVIRSKIAYMQPVIFAWKGWFPTTALSYHSAGIGQAPYDTNGVPTANERVFWTRWEDQTNLFVHDQAIAYPVAGAAKSNNAFYGEYKVTWQNDMVTWYFNGTNIKQQVFSNPNPVNFYFAAYDRQFKIESFDVTTGTNGACGSSNGSTFNIAPTNNLCNAGNFSAMSGNGPWAWTCQGINGGTTASCSADIKTWNLSVTMAGSGSGTVNSNPSGITCSSGSIADCSKLFPNGSNVDLFATPDWKSVFGGWFVGCSGTGACSINVGADTGVTAYFNSNAKLKLFGAATTHASLQEAYMNANDGETFLMQVYTFIENLNFNLPKHVKLYGGMDSNYSNTVGEVTTIQGSVTIQNGSAEIRDVVIW